MGLCSEHGIEHGPDADSIAGEAIITNTIDLRGDGLPLLSSFNQASLF
jgi:hypothetical protein